jgi:hypothetical protein
MPELSEHPAALKVSALLAAAALADDSSRAQLVQAVLKLPGELLLQGQPASQGGEEDDEEFTLRGEEEGPGQEEEEEEFSLEEEPAPAAGRREVPKGEGNVLDTPEGLAGTRAYLVHVLGLTPEKAQEAIEDARKFMEEDKAPKEVGQKRALHSRDARALAELYADVFDLLERTGQAVPEEEIHSADKELEGSDWIIERGEEGWQALHASEQEGGEEGEEYVREGSPLRYAREHFKEPTVKIIDADRLRSHSLSTEEFGSYAIHDDFDIVPQGEIWVSDATPEGERQFFIDNAITRMRALENGKSPEDAYDEGIQEERKERERSELANGGREGGETPQAITPKELYVGDGGERGGFQVKLVNGEKVRDHFKTDFTQGGNPEVYPWIPQGEVWIEATLDPDEKEFTLLHELTEMKLMKGGMGYDEAHKQASKTEFKARQEHARKVKRYHAVPQGRDDSEEARLQRAKDADLVKLPDDIEGTSCSNCMYMDSDNDYCTNEDVDQPVDPHECCQYWDNPKAKRKWRHRDAEKYARVRAPLTGVQIGMHYYRGGELIPPHVIKEMGLEDHERLEDARLASGKGPLTFIREGAPLQYMGGARAPAGFRATLFSTHLGRDANYKGGMWIPSDVMGNLEKMAQQEGEAGRQAKQQLDQIKEGKARSEKKVQEKVAKRPQRPTPTLSGEGGLKARLSELTSKHGLDKEQQAKAQRAWRAFRGYHGKYALHRIEELTNLIEERLAGRLEGAVLPEKDRKTLSRLHFIMGLAEVDQAAMSAPETLQGPQPERKVEGAATKGQEHQDRDEGGEERPMSLEEARAHVRKVAEDVNGATARDMADVAKALKIMPPKESCALKEGMKASGLPHE